MDAQKTEGRILLAIADRSGVEDVVGELLSLGVRHPISVVYDGMEVLEFVFSTGRHAGRPPGDLALIFLHTDLPVLDGIEVLQRLKRSGPASAIPVIALGDDAGGRAAPSTALGAVAFVHMPVDAIELRRAARAAGLLGGEMDR